VHKGGWHSKAIRQRIQDVPQITNHREKHPEIAGTEQIAAHRTGQRRVLGSGRVKEMSIGIVNGDAVKFLSLSLDWNDER
jgi:hypothetical protein